MYYTTFPRSPCVLSLPPELFERGVCISSRSPRPVQLGRVVLTHRLLVDFLLFNRPNMTLQVLQVRRHHPDGRHVLASLHGSHRQARPAGRISSSITNYVARLGIGGRLHRSL